MQIVAIADDESLVGRLDCQSPDILISLGDMYDVAIKRAVEHYRPGRTLAVRGNHDPDCPLSSGVTDLHITLQTIDGVRFGGFKGSWKYKSRGHHMFEQEEVSRLMRVFPAVDVFIAHNSPFGIHQRDSDVHQGFHGFVDYIHRTRPSLFLHGHQHVDQATVVGDTTVLGVFGERAIHIQPRANKDADGNPH